MKVTFEYSFQFGVSFKSFILLISFFWPLCGKAWYPHVCYILAFLAVKCLHAPLLQRVPLHTDNIKNCAFSVKVDQGI